jgi:hypothetical protein
VICNMKTENIRDEKGVVLVIALIILLVMTLIGISAVSTSLFENIISGNERLSTDAFYATEAGVQIAFNQLPDTAAIPLTKVGNDSYCWSGGPSDKGAPQPLINRGLYFRPGFESVWGFNRYQINASGGSLNALKQIEAQATWGPFKTGTEYN